MRIGIDLGGTKIEAIALGEDGSEQFRKRVAAPRGDYRATLTAIVALVHDVELAVGVQGTVGVGMPGTISPATGLVKNANSTWLNGQAFAEELPRLLNRPVRFANDANCFALSEAVDGAAAGAEIVFGVIAGTGVGGGVVTHGRVLSGANHISGEWGHNPMPWPREGEWPGPPCYCGRSGCIETFLSGSGFVRDYTLHGGAPQTAIEIASRFERGEPLAVASFNRYVDRFARSLAAVINLLDPDVIVLGGGLSNVASLYEAIPQQWGAFVFSDRVDTRLVRAMHGDSSGVRGAAWLWEKNKKPPSTTEQ
jgi:fructokinase